MSLMSPALAFQFFTTSILGSLEQLLELRKPVYLLDCQFISKDIRASLVAQMVKNLPAIQETHVRSLGQEDPLQKGMATHPNILAWEISWTEETIHGIT